MTVPLLLSIGVIVFGSCALWMLDRFVCRWVDEVVEQDAVEAGSETVWFTGEQR